LSLARAQLQRVQANLIGSRENYVRLVGSAPGVLDAPPPLPNLPQTAAGAVDVALRDNPTLLSALKQRDATDFDIRVARASRLPTLGIGATGNYVNYLGTLGSGTGLGVGQSGTSAGLGLNVSLPLFQGGRPAALVRQAQAQRAQAIESATAAERQVIASARSAYAVWQSSLQVISSSEQAVAANQLSLERSRREQRRQSHHPRYPECRTGTAQ
jgi:outer membrane protein